MTVKKKRPQDAQPHQRCVMGDLGFSPTSRNRAIFSEEKTARFAERVPHGIACYVFRGIRNYRNLSKTLDFMQLFGGVQLIPGFEQQLLFLPVVTSIIDVVGLTPCFYFLAATATDFDVLFPYATASETKTVCRPH